MHWSLTLFLGITNFALLFLVLFCCFSGWSMRGDKGSLEVAAGIFFLVFGIVGSILCLWRIQIGWIIHVGLPLLVALVVATATHDKLVSCPSKMKLPS